MVMMSGVVESVTTKDVTTKFGTKPTYSIKVGGKWIKCGFKNPNVQSGWTVDFDATESQYGLETKAVNILSRGAAPVPATGSVPAYGVVASSGPAVAAATSTGKAYSGFKEKVFPIPPLHGDRAIIRQNALARATDVYIAARGGKPFDLDTSNLDLIIEFARRFESYTAGDLDLQSVLNEATAATEQIVSE